MGVFIKEGDIKIDKGIYLRKGGLSRCRIIFPIKNEDDSINWFNLFTGGSWTNLIVTSLICLFLVGMVYAYLWDTSQLVECCNNYNDLRQSLNLLTSPKLTLP